MIRQFFGDLQRDAKILMISRGIRAFAFSYSNVVFAIYLDRLGYTPVMIGVIFTIAYLSAAVLTAVWGYLSDRGGRRKIVMLLAIPTILSNIILILLPEKCRPENRNQILAVNSCVELIMGSLGALASGLPQFLQEARGWSAVNSYKPRRCW